MHAWRDHAPPAELSDRVCDRRLLFDEEAHARHFAATTALIVGSPALVKPKRSLKAGDLNGVPLLQMSTRPYAWRQWFASLGLAVEGRVIHELF